MDVGCSGSIDTYSIIEKADYSFAELSCKILSEEKDEDFPDLSYKLREMKTKPLFWSDFCKDSIDLWEYDQEGGYVKNYLLDLFAKIDEVGGEYVVLEYSPENFAKDQKEYTDIINSVSSLAGSYGLEIVLLFSGENDREIIRNFGIYSLSENDHPFLRFGFDLENSEDYQVFLDEIENIDNLKYIRIPAEDRGERKFAENLALLAERLAETDMYLCVWSDLGEITDRVMSNRYI